MNEALKKYCLINGISFRELEDKEVTNGKSYACNKRIYFFNDNFLSVVLWVNFPKVDNLSNVVESNKHLNNLKKLLYC